MRALQRAHGDGHACEGERVEETELEVHHVEREVVVVVGLVQEMHEVGPRLLHGGDGGVADVLDEGGDGVHLVEIDHVDDLLRRRLDDVEVVHPCVHQSRDVVLVLHHDVLPCETAPSPT